MKGQMEMSLKERSTSVRVGEKVGEGVPGGLMMEILLDFKTRRRRVERLVKGFKEERDEKRLSSRVRSVMVGRREWGVRVV